MVATIGVVMAVVCEAHVPLLTETSSIAMSPEKPFPTSPSNVICKTRIYRHEHVKEKLMCILQDTYYKNVSLNSWYKVINTVYTFFSCVTKFEKIGKCVTFYLRHLFFAT